MGVKKRPGCGRKNKENRVSTERNHTLEKEVKWVLYTVCTLSAHGAKCTNCFEGE